MSTEARRRAVRNILSEQAVASQADLARLLAEQGFQVTQATVSRDLWAVGAVKARTADGSFRYSWEPGSEPGRTRDALVMALSTYVTSVRSSGNLVVIKTPPGAAHVVAAAIDDAGIEGILGTVAGDDTMLVVAGEESGGPAIAQLIEDLGVSG